MNKICSRCKQEKKSEEFFKNSKRRGGIACYCKMCHLEYKREHRKINKTILQTEQRYRNKNKTKLYEQHREYVKRSGWKVQQKWREKIKCENPSKFSEYQKRFYKKHPEKISELKERSKRWKKANKEKVAFASRKRHYLKKGAEGSHTFQEWEWLKQYYNFMCPGCGKREPEIRLTEDHIRPLSKGGSNMITNIQPLCRSCNSKKFTKTVIFNEEICRLELDPELYEIYSR